MNEATARDTATEAREPRASSAQHWMRTGDRARRKIRAPRLLLLVGLLPSGRLKRLALRRVFGWEVHETAWIGVCLFRNVAHARIGPGAYIGHGNVFTHLLHLELGEEALIGRYNTFSAAPMFLDRVDLGEARCGLVLGHHATLTLRHFVGCSGGVTIGAFTTFGGVRTTLHSHQVDVRTSRQVTRSVRIGEYCLVTSDVKILPGSVIPDRCVVAMGSVVAGELPEPQSLYSGSPATARKRLADGVYFQRTTGFVDAFEG